MTDQQHHLKQLLDKKTELEAQIAETRELFWKVQGAIDYLTEIGVTLYSTEAEQKFQETQS